MRQAELIAYLDDYLQLARYEDRSNNGLQVQGAADLVRVACAVDANLAAFKGAIERGAQLLIVHHGLFWSKHLQITGAHYERIKTLIAGGCGLYGAHIPLDAHPEVGNNIELARIAGLQNLQPWGEHKGSLIGWIGDLPEPVATAELYARIISHIGKGNRIQIGPSGISRRVAVLSGFGVDFAPQAIAAGADTLLTGETSHTWAFAPVELGLSVLFGGHYNTEKIGPLALARHLEQKFGLETVFVEVPSGL